MELKAEMSARVHVSEVIVALLESVAVEVQLRQIGPFYVCLCPQCEGALSSNNNHKNHLKH